METMTEEEIKEFIKEMKEFNEGFKKYIENSIKETLNPNLKDNEYRCSLCGETFKKGWTEVEALKEKNEIWGEDFPIDDCSLVCDDCFKEIM